ncbi:hypothetical protein SLS62_010586 [Diatrype stigma]|uniref:Heterokaryon incompatibility domain-containing protein n=1 Tax=Diatrype stigma TaxID=117547 RepID=A0AAN9UH80_9PEZI
MPRQTDQTRPTRLLEIPADRDSTGTLRLVNAETEHSYVALSYCWGGDQPCKLTKARLREGGVFQTVDLPRTILDAIEVARNLRITYIWIDALCIVQDDPESMWSELEKMPAIYSNATVTISAASAATCHEGFLRPREAVDFNKVAFKLRLRTRDGEEGNVFLAPWSKYAQLEGVEKEPINDRAWTLQEQVVSPRVLYYSFQQLHWICRGGIRADGGFCPTDRDTPWKGGSIYRIFALSQTTTDMVDPSISAVLAQPDEYASWRRNWGRLVQDYQARRLTNRDDKLVAISAVGTLFARYMGTGFVAGLFERDLAIDLLWNRADDSEAQPRPATYRAPSWSWASVDSKTQNKIATSEILARDAVTMEVLPWPDQQPPTPQARIGRVPLELRIRAWITKARLRNEGPRRVLEDPQWRLPSDSIACSLDAVEPDLDTTMGLDVELVEIYWYPTSPRRRKGGVPMDKVAGLIALRGEEDGRQTCRRIGRFDMEVSSIYGRAVPPGGRITRQSQPRRQMVHDAMQSQRCIICLA